MKNLFLLLCLALFSLSTSADSKKPSEKPPIKLVGTFHFANPGLDLIKTEVMNVMSTESQLYLAEMSQHISQFKPTAVMLEFNPENTEAINKQYQDYLAGHFTLPVNEVYQIGFRVAKLAGVKELLSLDERSIGWNAEPLFDYLTQKAPKKDAMLKQRRAEITNQLNQDQRNLNLEELMLKNNDPISEKENKSSYLLTNAVGAEDGFAGADAAASWWHRNFRVYAKIQKQAEQGHRVFALAGQGHVAILRDLLAIDEQFQAENPLPYLRSKQQ